MSVYNYDHITLIRTNNNIVILKEERKYQKGELIDGVTTRDFTAEEIEQNKKNSIVVKLFGEK